MIKYIPRAFKNISLKKQESKFKLETVFEIISSFIGFFFKFGEFGAGEINRSPKL